MHFLSNNSIFYVFQILNCLKIIIVFRQTMQNLFQLFAHIRLTLHMLDNIFFQIFIFHRTAEKWHADFFEKRSSEILKNEQNS